MIRWWQFSRKRHCPHVNVRGIYGDEINHTPGYRRNECLDCGRLLDGPVSISVLQPDIDTIAEAMWKVDGPKNTTASAPEFYYKLARAAVDAMKGGEQ